MPSWAQEACDIWEQTLNTLANNPQDLADKLDWAIKYSVFESYAQETYNKTLRDVLRDGATENEMKEMDVRFGTFSEQGIFNKLDAAGLLNHKIITEDYIERCKVRGPYNTRANIRAQICQKIDDSCRYRTELNWASFFVVSSAGTQYEISASTVNYELTTKDRNFLVNRGITIDEFVRDDEVEAQ